MKRGKRKRNLVVAEETMSFFRAVTTTNGYAPEFKKRCRIILLSAEGMPNLEISRLLNMSNATVSKWRNRFIEDGLGGLDTKPRSGRPRAVPRDALRSLIAQGLDGGGESGKSWTCRELSLKTGISKSTVQRVLAQLGLSERKRGEKCPVETLFSNGCKLLPVGFQTGHQISTAVVMCWKDHTFDGCALSGSEAMCVGRRTEAAWIDSMTHPAPSADGSTDPPPPLAILQKVDAIPLVRCKNVKVNIFVTTQDVDLIIDLLDWQAKTEKYNLNLLPGKAAWHQLTQNLDHAIKKTAPNPSVWDNARTLFRSLTDNNAHNDPIHQLFWLVQQTPSVQSTPLPRISLELPPKHCGA